MSIFVKHIIPLTVLALFVPGCDQSPQARPESKFTLAPPPSQEEVEQQEKAVSDFHKKFSNLLQTSTQSLKSNSLMNDFGGPKGNLKEAETFLEQIDTLDVSVCPDYYRKAYVPLKDAWVDFFKLVVKNQGDKKISGPVALGGNSPFSGLGTFHLSYSDLNFSDPEYINAIEKIKEKTGEYSKAANPRGNLMLN